MDGTFKVNKSDFKIQFVLELPNIDKYLTYVDIL